MVAQWHLLETLDTPVSLMLNIDPTSEARAKTASLQVQKSSEA